MAPVPAFRKPTFAFDYDVSRELKALRDYPMQPGKEDRAIPAKQANRLLLATWNIANLGLQDRREKDHRLIAEILGWFDLVAIQEVNDNLSGLAVALRVPRVGLVGGACSPHGITCLRRTSAGG